MNLFFAAVHVDPNGEPWLIGQRWDNENLVSEIMAPWGMTLETDSAISYMEIANQIDAGYFDYSK